MQNKLFHPRTLGAAVCAGLLLSATLAQAGIFHHKKKPLKPSDDALATVNSQQPDKALFDRAMEALKKNKFDVARLDLQTLLNTYPDSEYQMRAKLAIGDTWFKEGGSAALEQAESEYKDFITFFPNQPEAAEAQMKVSDIYYRQMEKPDRDPTNTLRAQEEYRQMLLQFPDSTLVPQAKQRLREVQEVLAEHEFGIGSYYMSRDDYNAAIARLQSLMDSYPLYSHADETLLDIGDAYAGEAKLVSQLKLDAAAKQRLSTLYLDRATRAYARVIQEYPMMSHADDARDRLEALDQPVPVPSPQVVAASEKEEQSRAVVNLKDKTVLLITARPSTVQASHVGEPTLTDPSPLLAPQLVKEMLADAAWAQHPDGKPAPPQSQFSNAGAVPGSGLTANSTSGNEAGNAAASTQNGGGLQLQDATGGSTAPDTSNVQPVTAPAPGSVPSAQPSGPAGNSVQGGAAAGSDSAPTTWPSAAPQANGGLPTVAPKNNTPLPTTQAPTEAPDQVNDVPRGGHAVNTADQSNTDTSGKKKKNPKPKYNSGEESSSKHKKKKGLDKLNPF